MDIRDIREIMGLSQAQVADELGVPRQEVIDCEENGETYLLLQYISAFPINPQVLTNPDVDPFLPSFDQTTPGHRLNLWREEFGISAEEFAEAAGISMEELRRFEEGKAEQLSRRRGEEIERKTGINRKWLMYGDGREKGTPKLHGAATQTGRTQKKTTEPRTASINRDAGMRIKQARKEAKLSREDLASLLDLSVSRVTQMESGYVRDQKADHIVSRIASISDGPGKEDPKSAGIRLREARKEAGLSVKEAAELMGLKYTTLAHLESGYVTGRHADELIEVIQQAPRKETHVFFNPKEAGIRIREERIKAGLTQKELGTILRLPTARISLIELGDVTEKEMERILLRIHGKPTREVMIRKIKPTEQVILGANIRETRERAGLSQKELGSMLNLPQTRVSLMERGRVDEATGKKILQMLEETIEKKRNESLMASKMNPSPKQARAHTPANPELGKMIQRARVAAGLSQKEVGEMLGLSQGRVSYMEQGKTDEETAQKVIRLISTKP